MRRQPGAKPLAIGHVVLVVPANVDQFDAVAFGRLAKLRIIAQKLVQARDDRQSPRDGVEDDRTPVRRDFSARRRNAHQKRVCLARFGQRGDDGDLPADAENFLAGLAGRLPIEHRDNFVGPVAQQADGGLRGIGIVVPIGDNHHAAWRVHGQSVPETCVEMQDRSRPPEKAACGFACAALGSHALRGNPLLRGTPRRTRQTGIDGRQSNPLDWAAILVTIRPFKEEHLPCCIEFSLSWSWAWECCGLPIRRPRRFARTRLSPLRARFISSRRQTSSHAGGNSLVRCDGGRGAEELEIAPRRRNRATEETERRRHVDLLQHGSGGIASDYECWSDSRLGGRLRRPCAQPTRSSAGRNIRAFSPDRGVGGRAAAYARSQPWPKRPSGKQSSRKASPAVVRGRDDVEGRMAFAGRRLRRDCGRG